MTREEALQGLASGSAHDRLKAARFLARNCIPADLQILRRVLRSEPVAYVRLGLEVAIKRASGSPGSINGELEHEDEYEVPPEVRTQIRNEVTEELAGQILHEIASPVGLIASAAAREIPEFDRSTTKRHVENLRKVFEAIEQLKCAAGVPKPEEFDLAGLLSDIVTHELGDRPVEVSLHGVRPTLITSDPALVRLAVANGIRNAVEAVLEANHNVPYPIVVTWGETDVDYWVSVLDRGPGIAGPAESAFGIGKTTKKGHSGFGLAIARQAIETLGGLCTLQPAMEGGARFEVRWER